MACSRCDGTTWVWVAADVGALPCDCNPPTSRSRRLWWATAFAFAVALAAIVSTYEGLVLLDRPCPIASVVACEGGTSISAPPDH